MRVELKLTDSNTVNVANLIQALLEMPQDAPVRTEGCDCLGDVREIELHIGTVYLNRTTSQL